MKRWWLFVAGLAAPVWAQEACPGLLGLQKQETRPSPTRKAQRIHLVKHGRPTRDYDELLQNLVDGDTLDLGDGRHFVFHGDLGQGSTAVVVDIGGGFALRIPRKSGRARGDSPRAEYEAVFNEFVAEYETLKAKGIPVVQYFAQRSHPPLYLVVEKKMVLFTLADYLKDADRGGRALALSKSDKKAIDKALDDFARRSWTYQSIGDFRADQLVWDGKSWTLIDWDAYGSRPLCNFSSDGTIFDPVETESDYGKEIHEIIEDKALLKHLQGIVNDERAAQKDRPWFERPWHARRSFDDEPYLIRSLEKEPLEKGRRFEVRSRNSKTLLNFHIEKSEGKQGNIASYSVRMKSGKRATLKIVLKLAEDNEGAIAHAVFDLDEKAKVLGRGEDFLIFTK